jgi:hypothetical protein
MPNNVSLESVHVTKKGLNIPWDLIWKSSPTHWQNALGPKKTISKAKKQPVKKIFRPPQLAVSNDSASESLEVLLENHFSQSSEQNDLLQQAMSSLNLPHSPNHPSNHTNLSAENVATQLTSPAQNFENQFRHPIQTFEHHMTHQSQNFPVNLPCAPDQLPNHTNAENSANQVIGVPQTLANQMQCPSFANPLRFPNRTFEHQTACPPQNFQQKIAHPTQNLRFPTQNFEHQLTHPAQIFANQWTHQTATQDQQKHTKATTAINNAMIAIVAFQNNFNDELEKIKRCLQDVQKNL